MAGSGGDLIGGRSRVGEMEGSGGGGRTRRILRV